jgi:hypothetical protein
LLQVLPIIGTLSAILGLRISLPEIISQASLVEIIATIAGWVAVGHILLGLLLCPLIAAFHLKRLMLENSITQRIQDIEFTTAPETTLFDRSVYEVENRLYQLLGGAEQKPKEIPVDIFLRIGFGLFVIAFFISPSMVVVLVSSYSQSDNAVKDDILSRIDDILGPLVLTGSMYVILPITGYINRLKSRLL